MGISFARGTSNAAMHYSCKVGATSFESHLGACQALPGFRGAEHNITEAGEYVLVWDQLVKPLLMRSRGVRALRKASNTAPALGKPKVVQGHFESSVALQAGRNAMQS